MKRILFLLIPLFSFGQIDIVGGEDADISDYPWQVALIEQSGGWEWGFCGGSIIDDNWILTAAHCLEDININNLYVRSGSGNSYAEEGVIYGVEEIIVHPNYNANTMNNDIALIKLSDSIVFDSNSQAINIMCDYQVNLGAQNPGTEATITGWGETETNNYNGILQVAEVLITNSSNYGWGQIDPDMIMAGYSNGGIDTCQGDSGGPMIVRDTEDTNWLLAGITSWGYGCAEAGYPGVYTRVSYFEDWICTNTNGEVCASEIEICNPVILGCTWFNACNYNPDATQNDGSCTFADSGYDCNGNCLVDDDNDGVCNPDEIPGCTDPEACNTNFEATDNDGSCEYAEGVVDCNGDCIEILSEIQECNCNENETYNSYTTYNPQLCTWFELCTCECINDINENGICDENELNDDYSQSIELDQGWNIWSTYINPENGSLEEVFLEIENDLIIVKDKNGNVYWPEYGLNSIGELTWGEGYQTKMSSYNNLNISGSLIPYDYGILIPSGWSIIAYLQQDENNIEEMMALIVDDIVIVKDEGGNVYWPEFGLNSINNMKAGEGYQIKLENATNLSFPYIATAQFYTEDLLFESYFQDPINTGENMTLGILTNSLSQELILGDEIIITDRNNLIVGKAHYREQITAITIWGDDPLTNQKDGLYINEPFYIKTWSKGDNILKNLIVLNWSKGNNTYINNGISVTEEIIFEPKNLPEKKLIKIINILGQETSQSGLNVNVFDDGSVEKKYIIK